MLPICSSIYYGVWCKFYFYFHSILFALKLKVLRICSMYAYSKSTKGLKKLLVCSICSENDCLLLSVFLLIFSVSYVFYLISFWLLDFCLFWVHFLQYLRNILLSFLPHQAQITAYVEYFGQFTSEQFPEDIAEVYSFCFYFWTSFSHPESWNETDTLLIPFIIRMKEMLISWRLEVLDVYNKFCLLKHVIFDSWSVTVIRQRKSAFLMTYWVLILSSC